MNKIEQYLIDSMLSYSEMDENIWLIDDENSGVTGIVLAFVDPLIIVRAVVMDIPAKRNEEFFKKLLELNSADLLHGAYAIDNGQVVLVDTLEYEWTSYEELRATLDAFSLALAQHYPVLSGFRS